MRRALIATAAALVLSTSTGRAQVTKDSPDINAVLLKEMRLLREKIESLEKKIEGLEKEVRSLKKAPPAHKDRDEGVPPGLKKLLENIPKSAVPVFPDSPGTVGVDRKALAKIELPNSPDHEQIENYIGAIFDANRWEVDRIRRAILKHTEAPADSKKMLEWFRDNRDKLTFDKTDRKWKSQKSF